MWFWRKSQGSLSLLSGCERIAVHFMHVNVLIVIRNPNNLRDIYTCGKCGGVMTVLF